MREPCDNCPWRRDAPTGEWTREHFRQVRDRCLGVGILPMTCHKAKSRPPEEWAGLYCAGWARINPDAPGVKVLIGEGIIQYGDLEPLDLAQFYESFEEMVTSNGLSVVDLGSAGDEFEHIFFERVCQALSETPVWTRGDVLAAYYVAMDTSPSEVPPETLIRFLQKEVFAHKPSLS